MTNLKVHTKLSLIYFLIAAILGVLLRSFYPLEIPINYRYIVHAHSHIALLGWIYIALTTILYKLYLKNHVQESRYRTIFWFTQLTLIGMLLTFPFMGYALFSILFSTLFLFASYWFTWFFIKNSPLEIRKDNSYKCIKVALYYMVLSSLGPWALGAIMSTLGTSSIWYRLSIYFYLHFQYNGWMLLALVGLLFYVFESHKIYPSPKNFKRFFWSINLGVLLTFFLSVLWTKPNIAFYLLSGIGALFQLLAFVMLIGMFLKEKKRLNKILSKFQLGLIKVIAALLVVKIVLQLLTAFPYFANLAATNLDFTIGYLHWTFLGVISLGLFLFLDYYKLIKIPRAAYLLYLIGFIGSETLIFYKGIMVWQGLNLFEGYFTFLAIISAFIPVAVIALLFYKKPTQKELQ